MLNRCHILQSLIWVYTVCQLPFLWVSRLNWVNTCMWQDVYQIWQLSYGILSRFFFFFFFFNLFILCGGLYATSFALVHQIHYIQSTSLSDGTFSVHFIFSVYFFYSVFIFCHFFFLINCWIFIFSPSFFFFSFGSVFFSAFNQYYTEKIHNDNF